MYIRFTEGYTLVYRSEDTASRGAVPLQVAMGVKYMPGTIINSASRKRIAECHIKTAQYTSDRKGLIAIYKAARISLVGGKLFEEVCEALSKRATELGVNMKGGK